MQQQGEYRIRAARQAVWRALNDPEVLARSIEGCQSLTRVADDAFEAKIKAKVGPVSALFTADIKLEDINPPTSYTLRGAAKGGPAGLGKGVARVTLDEEAGETVLRYEAEGNVSGKLAQIGQRLVDAASRKMADDFFARFAAEVAPEGAPATAASSPPQSARMLWIAGGAVAVLALVVVIYLIAR